MSTSDPEGPKPAPDKAAAHGPIALTAPVGCLLWREPESLATNSKPQFERLEVYVDDSHFIRSLLKCRECGQRYFYEFNEWVDWKEGNDKIYTTYLPVSNQTEIDQLKAADMFELTRYVPRLQWDAGKPAWKT